MAVNGIFRAARIAASGMKANRGWMNLISNNIANAQSVDTGKLGADGNVVPYARQVPVFSKVLSESFRRNKVNEDVMNGVAVKGIASLKDNVKKVYNPSHPLARKPGSEDAGYVYFPGVSIPQELADLRMASASYEANLTVASVSSSMTESALNLGRR